MADTTREPAPTDDDALKKRLMNRVAIAAVMIVALLGSLAVFDAMYVPRPSVPAKMAALPKAEPPPVAREDPRTAEPAPAAPEAHTPEAPKTEVAKAPEPPPPPVVEAQPALPKAQPAPAERTASPGAPPLQASRAEKPLTKPATARPAVAKPTEVAPPPAATRPDARREIARTAPKHAPASKPITQAAAERGFSLQMGVFNNVANAEDLRAKLEALGIPASIEARVHVGPFASREEAEAAREKLKALGMESGMLVTLRK